MATPKHVWLTILEGAPEQFEAHVIVTAERDNAIHSLMEELVGYRPDWYTSKEVHQILEKLADDGELENYHWSATSDVSFEHRDGRTGRVEKAQVY